ncbi:hypothetical protein, partial [Kitasatospora sp. NPDC054795]
MEVILHDGPVRLRPLTAGDLGLYGRLLARRAALAATDREAGAVTPGAHRMKGGASVADVDDGTDEIQGAGAPVRPLLTDVHGGRVLHSRYVGEGDVAVPGLVDGRRRTDVGAGAPTVGG